MLIVLVNSCVIIVCTCMSLFRGALYPSYLALSSSVKLVYRKSRNLIFMIFNSSFFVPEPSVKMHFQISNFILFLDSKEK